MSSAAPLDALQSTRANDHNKNDLDISANQDIAANQDATANVDPSEVDKFNKLASEWWDKTGAFATLHEINPLRLNWIEDNVGRGYKGNNDSLDTGFDTSLAGKKIVDVGCGGGILSESMARRGAEVTGIDLGV